MNTYRIKLRFCDCQNSIYLFTTREYYVKAPSLDAAIADAKSIKQADIGICVSSEGQVIDIRDLSPAVRNVRIHIEALTRACRALGEVKVVAAGTRFATLECDENMRLALAKADVDWRYD